VAVQARRAAPEQERRAAGHADHPAVEPGPLARHHGHVDVGREHRIVVVARGVAVDENDGDPGAAPSVERARAPRVLAEPPHEERAHSAS